MILAHILRPRGNKGEVAAVVLTDFTERLVKLREVFVGNADAVVGEPRAIEVKTCWLSQNHHGQAVFHFEGVNSINEAEQFRGMDVLLPFEQRAELPTGQHFVSDLIGCEVFEGGARLGKVSDVQFPGEGSAIAAAGTPVLEVETAQGELLIPFAEDICTRIDTGARRIEVILPEGLRDLNERG
ncbi:MAG: ribosome maturation factor RimM [Candidatus Acidiferrum sp.]